MEIRYILKTILLPPFSHILLLLLAWRLRNSTPKLAKTLFLLATLSLWLLATPITSNLLALSLEKDVPLQPQNLSHLKADAIVILSASQNETAAEFAEPVSGKDALVRIRYGAFLERKTQLPILLTGGSVSGTENRSLAETMAFDLLEGFGVTARWLETNSRTTAENAKFSYKTLEPEGKTTIVLVTQSLHMIRAKWSFEQAGLTVIPAPTGFIDIRPVSPLSFIPNANSLHLSSQAIHEWLGYIVYVTLK